MPPFKKRKKGKIRNVVPLIIDGIRFKSSLEGYCYKQLKANRISFKYEEDRFTLVDKFTYNVPSWELGKIKGVKKFKEARPNIQAITYLPDFTNLRHGWVIECKGFATERFLIIYKLFKRYLHDNKLNYDLYMPRNRKQIDETINLIKSKNGPNKARRK